MWQTKTYPKEGGGCVDERVKQILKQNSLRHAGLDRRPDRYFTFTRNVHLGARFFVMFVRRAPNVASLASFGQIWTAKPKLCPELAKLGQPREANSWPTLANHGPTTHVKFDRHHPNLVEFGPTSAEFGPSSVESDRLWPVGPDSGPASSRFGRSWPKHGRTRPNLV